MEGESRETGELKADKVEWKKESCRIGDLIMDSGFPI